VILEIAAITGCVLASVPATNALVNLVLFSRAPRRPPLGSPQRVSVLIPARDEQFRVGAALEAVLANPEPDLDVVVVDDHSRDRTAEVVAAFARRDPRVRLVRAPALPRGWCGKQHACRSLAREARGELLVFVDADVTLAADAVSRIVGVFERTGADLVSGFPRQHAGTLLERMLIPLIHFVLLGFLPMAAMKLSGRPGLAAGCGQLMAARREAYEDVGGHGAIRASRHDGITLPRAFRRRGFRTDLFDATDLASCRMYGGAREVWNGLAKNATEGMASPAAIVPWSLLLVGGQVLPAALAVAGVGGWALAGTALAYATRAMLAWRFRQSWVGVLLHSPSVALLVALQWFALGRQLLSRPVAWKGRTV